MANPKNRSRLTRHDFAPAPDLSPLSVPGCRASAAAPGCIRDGSPKVGALARSCFEVSRGRRERVPT
eukprot:scaffold65923_cov29-Phaeocystis_antarctica.AAC.1